MRSSLFCAYFSRFSGEVCYYNLSPQGDGNRDENVDNQATIKITTYPRKGTETKCWIIGAKGLYITTYPRKGTETITIIHHMTKHGNYNLSPQGDGNFATAATVTEGYHYNLSP